MMPPESKKVLIIENNIVVFLALEAYFHINEYRIASAKTGEQGIARAGRFHPDLLLIRGNLPDSNGIEIIRRVHQSHGLWHVPAVFYTGSGWQKNLYRWNLPFNTHYLSSPFDYPRLDAIIGEITRQGEKPECADAKPLARMIV